MARPASAFLLTAYVRFSCLHCILRLAALGRLTTTPTIVPVGKTRVGVLLGLPDLLSRIGLPVAAFLEEAGLPPDLLSSPDNLMDVTAGARLATLGVNRTGCPHFGLLLGQGVKLSALGPIGDLAQNATDVGSALRGLILNLHLNGHAVVPTLTVHQRLAEFQLRLFPDVQESHDVLTDFTVAASYNVMRALCGPTFAPIEVLLTRRLPPRRAPYAVFFRCPVRFGEDHSALVFSEHWLSHSVVGANAARRATLEGEVSAASRRQKLPPEVAARRALFAGLALGDVSVGRVAAMMGLHPRALNRQLSARGTTLAALLKDVRYQVARELLMIDTLPITEIAATLRYADLATFTRAFHSWSGTSPMAWRKSRRHESAL